MQNINIYKYPKAEHKILYFPKNKFYTNNKLKYRIYKPSCFFNSFLTLSEVKAAFTEFKSIHFSCS